MKQTRIIKTTSVKKFLTCILLLSILMNCVSTIAPMAAFNEIGDTGPIGFDTVPDTVPHDLLFPAPPYKHEYLPGNLFIGFNEPYFGSFSSEGFQGLNVIEITDSKKALYDLWSADPNYDQNDPNVRRILDYIKSKIGCEYQIKISEEMDIWEAIQILEKNPNVAYAMPCFLMNHTSAPTLIPNDPDYANQWGMGKIQAPEAWYLYSNVYSTHSKVRVGILDSGMNYVHPDLIYNVNLTDSYNVAKGGNTGLLDYIGSGTHAAGTIGAVNNNNIGIAGVCGDAELVPIKIVLSDTNPSTLMNFIETAVLHAETKKLPIITMGYEVEYFPPLHNAISLYNGLFTISAGNSGTNNDISSVNYILNGLGNVIFVANSSNNAFDTLDPTSNFGQMCVALAAPGNNIYSTLLGSSYGYMSGTSAATPFVAGAAAMLLSVMPNMTTQELKAAILNSTDYRMLLTGMVSSNGRLNVYNMLKQKTVHGYVWPMAVNDLGLGNSFLQLHDIVVELRKNFWDPATKSTISVLVPNSAVSGLGEFTITDVAFGNYVLAIKRPGYLVRCMNITISPSYHDIIEVQPPNTAGDNGVYNLLPGDCDDSYKIDNDDIALILEQISVGISAPHQWYRPGTDFRASGASSYYDRDVVLNNWNINLYYYAGSNTVQTMPPP